MEIYKCEACRYLFAETRLVKRCPDCGKPFVVRPATKAEQEEYHRFRIEFGYEEPARVS